MTAPETSGAAPAAPAARPKKTRTLCVKGRHQTADGWLTLVEITERGPRSVKVDLYYVSSIPADYGRAFLWQGIAHKGASRYHVHLGDQPGGEAPAVCDCIAGEAGRVQCRHVAATLKMLAEGKL